MSDNFRHCPKRLRESDGVTIVWEHNAMSVADLFDSSEPFRRHVRARALALGYFVRRTEYAVRKLEYELEHIKLCLGYELGYELP